MHILRKDDEINYIAILVLLGRAGMAMALSCMHESEHMQFVSIGLLAYTYVVTERA